MKKIMKRMFTTLLLVVFSVTLISSVDLNGSIFVNATQHSNVSKPKSYRHYRSKKGRWIDTDDFNTKDQKKFCSDLKEEIEKSDIITNPDNISITPIDEDKIDPNANYIVVNDVDDAIEYLEEQQEEIENYNEMPDNTVSLSNLIFPKWYIVADAASTTKTVHKVAKKTNAGMSRCLEASITYNTKTNVITKVYDRHFYYDGFTLMNKCTDRHYPDPTYSASKKTVKIKCNYSAVYEFYTSGGAIEVCRKAAYMSFKWNKSDGVHDISAGFR